MDVYCAPNTGGESFGMVLTEAMAAGAAGAGQRPRGVPGRAAARRRFGRRRFGRRGPGTASGRAVPHRATPGALASALAALLDDPQRRAALGAAAQARAAAFDWPVVAADVLRVYRAAIAADPRRVPGRTVASTR